MDAEHQTLAVEAQRLEEQQQHDNHIERVFGVACRFAGVEWGGVCDFTGEGCKCQRQLKAISMLFYIFSHFPH